jgi:hypothetical protein
MRVGGSRSARCASRVGAMVCTVQGLMPVGLERAIRVEVPAVREPAALGARGGEGPAAVAARWTAQEV